MVWKGIWKAATTYAVIRVVVVVSVADIIIDTLDLMPLAMRTMLAGYEESCASLFRKIRSPGLETWLLQVPLAVQQEESFIDSPWYKQGLGRYRYSDWPMEIDRSHLNNPDLDVRLRRDVERFVTTDMPVV